MIKGQVNAVTRQRKQQGKYVGVEAGLVILLLLPLHSFSKLLSFILFHHLGTFPECPI